jgi:hypothetical protein
MLLTSIITTWTGFLAGNSFHGRARVAADAANFNDYTVDEGSGKDTASQFLTPAKLGMSRILIGFYPESPKKVLKKLSGYSLFDRTRLPRQNEGAQMPPVQRKTRRNRLWKGYREAHQSTPTSKSLEK